MNLTIGALQEVPLGCIYLIFRGLNFESNEELGENGHLWTGVTDPGRQSLVICDGLVTPINGISAFTKLFSARQTQKTISKLLKSPSHTERWLRKNTDTRSGGFSGTKAYMQYVEYREKFHDEGNRRLYDAIICNKQKTAKPGFKKNGTTLIFFFPPNRVTLCSTGTFAPVT